MNGICPESVNYLVQQLEYDSPNVGVNRIPFAAIDTFVLWKCSRCVVESRIDGE
jgi:hypothetical protein